MRRGALLNDAQLNGMLPTSVGGGENAPGNWSLMAGFCGPGSLMLLGFLALIAPCGGSFGLPKVISLFTGVAFAVVMVAAATPPAAVAANMSRLENIAYRSFSCVLFDHSAGAGTASPEAACFLFSPNSQVCSRSR